MNQNSNEVMPTSAILFEVGVDAVHPCVSDIEDEVRDQLGYAFVAEDKRRFRLLSVDTVNGSTSAMVEVAGEAADVAEADLAELLRRSFLSLAKGGRIDFNKPRIAQGKKSESQGSGDRPAMFRIRNFGNDATCSDLAALTEAIQRYRGKSVTVVDLRPAGRSLFVDVSEAGDVSESYGTRAPVELGALFGTA